MPCKKLLTNLASSSRTGEYRPSVVFARTSLRSVVLRLPRSNIPQDGPRAQLVRCYQYIYGKVNPSVRIYWCFLGQNFFFFFFTWKNLFYCKTHKITYILLTLLTGRHSILNILTIPYPTTQYNVLIYYLHCYT